MTFPQEIFDAGAVGGGSRVAGGPRARLLLFAVGLDGSRQDVLDVEEGVALEPDRDESGMHPGKHPVDPREVDVSDQALVAAPLVQDLDGPAVLEHRDPRLRRSRVNEQLASHALANRR